MGCDIHLFVEVKKTFPSHEIKERWVPVGNVFKVREEDYSKIPYKYIDGREYDGLYGACPYNGRNYVLFGFLANVRNGYGVAGSDTGDAIKPLANPRGLPGDVSYYVKSIAEEWGINGHSHSYFTIEELENADWSQEIIKRGVVTEEQYKKYKEKGKPDEWLSGVMGGNTTVLDESDYPPVSRDNKTKYYVRITWKDTLGEYCSNFMDALKEVKQLMAYKDVEDARFVFWFDN